MRAPQLSRQHDPTLQLALLCLGALFSLRPLNTGVLLGAKWLADPPNPWRSSLPGWLRSLLRQVGRLGTLAMPQMQATVVSLAVYPLKGGGALRLSDGSPVETWPVMQAGLLHDREFVVVDSLGHFITQRDSPRLALIHPVMASPLASTLELQCDAMGGSCSVPMVASSRERLWNGVASLEDFPGASLGDVRPVKVFGRYFEGLDAGDVVASWISEALQTPGCRLLRRVAKVNQPLRKSMNTPTSGEMLLWQDSQAVSMLSLESVEKLNHRLQRFQFDPVGLNRFRANIVIQFKAAPPRALPVRVWQWWVSPRWLTGLAHLEDAYSRVAIDGVDLVLCEWNSRCRVTTVNQETGEVGGDNQPLRELQTYRRVRAGGTASPLLSVKYALGQVVGGTLHVGAGVDVQEVRFPPWCRDKREEGRMGATLWESLAPWVLAPFGVWVDKNCEGWAA